MIDEKFDLFFSYARANYDWAYPFAAKLRTTLEKLLGYKLNPFLDISEIHCSEDFFKKIINSISNCEIFIPIYSPEYFASKMCNLEWGFARYRSFTEKQNLIYPVLH